MIRLRGTLWHMARSEILDMVEPDTLARIKETDPNPVIKVFGVANEGDAKPKLQDIGTVVARYLKDAVQKLFDRLKTGIQVYSGHAEHTNRVSIGEVVGSALKEIRGINHALAAIWIKPEYASQNFDVASVEADVEFTLTGERAVQVNNIHDITAIALGNSATEKPAFSGATLLGAMTAFAENEEEKIMDYTDPDENPMIPDGSAAAARGIKTEPIESVEQKRERELKPYLTPEANPLIPNTTDAEKALRRAMLKSIGIDAEDD